MDAQLPRDPTDGQATASSSSRVELWGRYNLISNLTVLGERFEFDASQLALEAAYNVAPIQNVLTVMGGESRRAGFMRWGLIPFCAKNRSIGSRMINARAETVADRPPFGEAFRRRLRRLHPPLPQRRIVRVAAHGVRQAPYAHRDAVRRALSRNNVVQKRSWRA